MSRRREDHVEGNDEEESSEWSEGRSFNSDLPGLEEDNTEESDESGQNASIETDDLAASILAFILRNR